jgi:hypothetical protein
MNKLVPGQRNQQRPPQQARGAKAWKALVPLWPALMLAGCGEISVNPLEWYHGLEGGAIAAQRPPPPGATDPYPNLATPPRPKAPDEAARQVLAQRLVADRALAEEVGAEDPLVATAPGAAHPQSPAPLVAHPVAAPAPPVLPPSAPGAATASFQAAQTTAPASPPAASPAPASAPIASSAPATPSPATPSPATPLPATPSPATPAAAPAGPLPTMPTTPPERPIGLPESFSPPARLPASAALPPPDVPGHSITVTFLTGSADLPPGTLSRELHPLVVARGVHPISVLGRGEARSYDPAVQQAALALALARAQAVAAALRGAGVPEAAMQIRAEPFGRGATASLLQ